MSDVYDLRPSEAELDDESLFDEVDKHRYCYCSEKRLDVHTGDDGCGKCGTVGAHQWITVCACCGHQQSRFETAEYLEAE